MQISGKFILCLVGTALIFSLFPTAFAAPAKEGHSNQFGYSYEYFSYYQGNDLVQGVNVLYYTTVIQTVQLVADDTWNDHIYEVTIDAFYDCGPGNYWSITTDFYDGLHGDRIKKAAAYYSANGSSPATVKSYQLTADGTWNDHIYVLDISEFYVNTTSQGVYFSIDTDFYDGLHEDNIESVHAYYSSNGSTANEIASKTLTADGTWNDHIYDLTISEFFINETCGGAYFSIDSDYYDGLHGDTIEAVYAYYSYFGGSATLIGSKTLTADHTWGDQIYYLNISDFQIYNNQASYTIAWKYWDGLHDEMYEDQQIYYHTCSIPTPTPQPTRTPTKTPTLSPTYSPTFTWTPTLTPSASPTSTLSPTLTPTLSPSSSPTHSPTLTPTQSPTFTLSPTLTPTESPTLSPTVTQSPTDTPTATPTCTQTPATTEIPYQSPTPTIVPTQAPVPAFSHVGIAFILTLMTALFVRRKNN